MNTRTSHNARRRTPHRFWIQFFLGCLLALPAPFTHAAAQENDWQLVYADDFEREEVGPAWVIIGRQEPTLRIIDGELAGGGAGATILFAAPVPGDQKIIFEARWLEGTGRAMSQFGALLKGSEYYGSRSGLHMVHGRARNSLNVIEFMASQVKKNDGPLPAPGKKYRFEATVEGTHVTFIRDGETLIEGEIPFPLDGPGFDRIFFYANAEQIRFDSIEIYRKPRPDGIVPAAYPFPGWLDANGYLRYDTQEAEDQIDQAIQLHLAGDTVGALDEIETIESPESRLAGYLTLAQDPVLTPYRELTNRVAKLLKEHPELEPEQPEGALSLHEAAQLASRASTSRSLSSVGYSTYLIPRLDPLHPFYNAIVFQHAREMLMGEGGLGSDTPKARGMQLMNQLYLRDPRNELIRFYLGENIPWGEEYQSFAPEAPLWARTLRETQGRLLHIINWWFEEHQSEDGQLGGGWGDDVEALRAWGPTLIVSDANQSARQGMKRLIDGAWKHAYGGLEEGYQRKIWDVEHSAEPTADTQPLMLLFEPENPVYVERNRKLLPLVRDLWTVESPSGLLFKSAWMGADGVDDSPGTRANVPYHTRGFKGLTWLAWHGDDPEVEATWLSLADAWVEATLRAEDGKLAGVVPAAIDPVTNQLGSGLGNWYRPRLSWSYYNWGEANHTHIFGLLTSAFLKTGDETYMRPIFASLRQALAYKPVEGIVPLPPEEGSAVTPSPEYQRYFLHQLHRKGYFVPYLIAYRNQTGSSRFDDYLREVATLPECSAIARFQVTGEVDDLIIGLEKTLEETIRYNLPMYTSEIDRTDDLQRLPGTTELYALTTGAIDRWRDSLWPTHVATWSHRNNDWAALTRRTGPRTVQIQFYSFDEDDSRFGLTLSNLPKGDYQLEWKANNGKSHRQEVSLQDRTYEVELDLPANQSIQITLTPAEE